MRQCATLIETWNVIVKVAIHTHPINTKLDGITFQIVDDITYVAPTKLQCIFSLLIELKAVSTQQSNSVIKQLKNPSLLSILWWKTRTRIPVKHPVIFTKWINCISCFQYIVWLLKSTLPSLQVYIRYNETHSIYI